MRGTNRLVARGSLSYTVIPVAHRDIRHPKYAHLMGRNVVCASEITMNGRIQVRVNANGSHILQVVPLKPPHVWKGDVLVIERGFGTRGGVVSGRLGPFGNWDVRWRASRLFITPLRVFKDS